MMDPNVGGTLALLYTSTVKSLDCKCFQHNINTLAHKTDVEKIYYHVFPKNNELI